MHFCFMKKAGWIIIPLFIVFMINALVKEKEFLAPDGSVSEISQELVPNINSTSNVASAKNSDEGVFFRVN